MMDKRIELLVERIMASKVSGGDSRPLEEELKKLLAQQDRKVANGEPKG